MLRTLFKTSRKRKAQAAHAKAKAAYDRAVERGDTREQHHLAKQLSNAMTELLKAESVKVIRR